MKFFDSHCHLQFPQYEKDLPDVLARMEAEGVGAVVVGTDLETSKAGIELAEKHDFLWASVGMHPNDPEPFVSAQYEALAKHPKAVAIGECGLDYFRSNGEGQKEKFQAQIEFAQKLNKPLIVHCRNAHDDCSEVLKNFGIKVPIVMHFFTGTADLAQQYLDLGCYLSFPGPITFTDMYDAAVRATPIDRILTETDAPFAAPVPYRGKRNEPAYVVEIVKKITVIKGISTEEARGRIIQNARNVFNLQY